MVPVKALGQETVAPCKEESVGRWTQEKEVPLPRGSQCLRQPLLCKGDNPTWPERPVVISVTDYPG